MERDIGGIWLKTGQRVKITNPYFKDMVCTILAYDWITCKYLVEMENGKVFPFKEKDLTDI